MLVRQSVPWTRPSRTTILAFPLFSLRITYHVLLLLRLPLPLFTPATGPIAKRYSDLGVVKDPALGRHQARRIDCGYGTCGFDLIVGRKSGIGAGIGPAGKWRDRYLGRDEEPKRYFKAEEDGLSWFEWKLAAARL